MIIRVLQLVISYCCQKFITHLMYARCTLLNYGSGQSVFVIVQCFIAQSVGAQSYNYVYPCELVRRCLSSAVRPANSSLSIQSCNVRSCNFSTPVTTANAMKLSHYVQTWRHSQNRKYITYCIVVRGGPRHTATWNMQRKFHEVGLRMHVCLVHVGYSLVMR